MKEPIEAAEEPDQLVPATIEGSAVQELINRLQGQIGSQAGLITILQMQKEIAEKERDAARVAIDKLSEQLNELTSNREQRRAATKGVRSGSGQGHQTGTASSAGNAPRTTRRSRPKK